MTAERIMKEGVLLQTLCMKWLSVNELVLQLGCRTSFEREPETSGRARLCACFEIVKIIFANVKGNHF